MKLYRISQNDNVDWDTFDAAVVAAESAEDARDIHPDGRTINEDDGTWVKDPSKVHVELIGDAIEGTERGVVLSSFRAG